MKVTSAAAVVLSCLAGSGLAAPSKQAEAMHYNHMSSRDAAVEEVKTLQKLAAVPMVQKFFSEFPLVEKVVNVALSGEPVTKENVGATEADVEALERAITATPMIATALKEIPLLGPILGSLGLGNLLGPVDGILKTATGAVDGLTGGATTGLTGLVNGVADTATGALGGSGGSKTKREEAAAQLDLQAILAALTKGDIPGLLGAITGAVGDVGKTATGAVGGVTGALNGVTGGALAPVTGALNGAVNDATGAVGKAAGAVDDVAKAA